MPQGLLDVAEVVIVIHEVALECDWDFILVGDLSAFDSGSLVAVLLLHEAVVPLVLGRALSDLNFVHPQGWVELEGFSGGGDRHRGGVVFALGAQLWDARERVIVLLLILVLVTHAGLVLAICFGNQVQYVFFAIALVREVWGKVVLLECRKV